jgi:hypothetical protein
MECRQLDGKRVLLLFLEKSGGISLLAGGARWNGTSLSVNPRPAAPEIPVPSPAVERDGFDPAVLQNLVGDDKYVALAERYAADVVWCAPMLVDEVPDAAEPVPGFLGGLAMGGNGELYLMRVR